MDFAPGSPQNFTYNQSLQTCDENARLQIAFIHRKIASIPAAESVELGEHTKKAVAMIDKESHVQAVNVAKILQSQPRLAWMLEKFFIEIQSKSPETYLHTMNVAAITARLSSHLSKQGGHIPDRYVLSSDQKAKLAIAALFHDYGKLWIPSDILHSGERLSDPELHIVLERIDQCNLTEENKQTMRLVARSMGAEDFPMDMNLPINKSAAQYLNLAICPDGKPVLSDTALRTWRRNAAKSAPDNLQILRHHVLYTWELLDHESLSLPKELYDLAKITSYHHEWLNGQGYPFQKSGDEISGATRIMQVADHFDALTAKRSYKAAISPDDAISTIKRLSDAGKMDAILVDACEHKLLEQQKTEQRAR